MTQVVAKFWCGRVVKGKVLAVDHEDSNIHVTRATVSNADKLKEGTRATLLCCLNTNAKTEVLLHGVRVVSEGGVRGSGGVLLCDMGCVEVLLDAEGGEATGD